MSGRPETSLSAEVMQLASLVPREPGTVLPKGASDWEIEGFASTRRGVSLPPEVKEWLRFTDGPKIGPGGVFGLRDYGQTYEILPGFAAKSWLPLGTDGCGNYYVQALDSPDNPLRPVYFIDACGIDGFESPAYAVASGFWRFLWFLFTMELGERRWPFDAGFVLANDPDLAGVKSANLPWVADERGRD